MTTLGNMTVIEAREPAFSTLKNLLSLNPKIIYIRGGNDSGKSTMLQSLKEELANSILIDCLECVTMTVLYERVLSAVGSRAAKPCSTVTEFACRMMESQSTVYLLLDEVERLLQVDSNALPVLFRLPEMTEVRLICASREDFYSFGPVICGGAVPIILSLSSPSADELTRMLVGEISSQVKSLPVSTISSYIQSIQQVASSTSKEMDVWRGLAWSLIEPIVAGRTEPYKLTRLPRLVQERLDSQNKLELFHQQIIGELDILQKYLLVGAFIASFQTVKEDVRVFGAELLKKKRVRKAPFNPAKDSANNDIKLNVKLPKLFDQTRLLAIFYYLFEGLTFLPSLPRLQLSIRGLCDRGLLRASNATKMDSLRYRVNISKDFAQAIAQSINVDLNKLVNI